MKRSSQPSAIRVNGSDLIKKLKGAANCRVAIISGNTEAMGLENSVEPLGKSYCRSRLTMCGVEGA